MESRPGCEHGNGLLRAPLLGQEPPGAWGRALRIPRSRSLSDSPIGGTFPARYPSWRSCRRRQPTSLFNRIVMLVLLVGGLGLIARARSDPIPQNPASNNRCVSTAVVVQ